MPANKNPRPQQPKLVTKLLHVGTWSFDESPAMVSQNLFATPPPVIVHREIAVSAQRRLPNVALSSPPKRQASAIFIEPAPTQQSMLDEDRITSVEELSYTPAKKSVFACSLCCLFNTKKSESLDETLMEESYYPLR